MRNTAALLLSGLALACSSPPPDAWDDPAVEAPERGGRNASYAMAVGVNDLTRLVQEDLDAGDPQQVFAGLERFAGRHITERTATRGSLVFEGTRPGTLLQFGGGRSVMTAVEELGRMLAGAAEDERTAAFLDLESGDLDAVERHLQDPMGIWHPDTVAMDRDLRPYALLAQGVIGYRDIAASGDATEAELESTLAVLAQAQTELALIDVEQGVFLANAAAAQSLERAGQLDAAGEYWLRIADSDHFDTLPDPMRELVSARIHSHSMRMKERLIVEVEDERRAELRARDEAHTQKLQGIRAKHDEFDSWARAGFADARRGLAELAAEDEATRRRLEELAVEAAGRDEALAGRIADSGVRIDELGGSVADLTAGISDVGGDVSALNERLTNEVGRLDERTTRVENRATDLDLRSKELSSELSRVEASRAATPAEPSVALDVEAYAFLREGLVPEEEPQEDVAHVIPERVVADLFVDVFGLGGGSGLDGYFVPGESVASASAE